MLNENGRVDLGVNIGLGGAGGLGGYGCGPIWDNDAAWDNERQNTLTHDAQITNGGKASASGGTLPWWAMDLSDDIMDESGGASGQARQIQRENESARVRTSPGSQLLSRIAPPNLTCVLIHSVWID